MNVQYERQIDEITTEELRPDLYYQRERNPTGPERRWPKVIGIVEIISGFVTAFLGAMEVFIVPLTDNIQDTNVIYLSKTNCYGAGILAGIMMILTGSTAIRASISKRASTVYRFYNLTMLTLALYVALTIFLITAYGLGWTVKSNYPPNTHIHEVHIFMTISTVLGLLFVTSAFVKYYDLVFCGEMQLGKKWLECLCCCFNRRVRQRFFHRAHQDPLHGAQQHTIYGAQQHNIYGAQQHTIYGAQQHNIYGALQHTIHGAHQ